MALCTVYRYETFSREAGLGNPVGIVFGGERLTPAQMMRFTRSTGYAECAFASKDAESDAAFRFFMPGKEMPVCSHAVLAAAAASARHYGLEHSPLRIKTGAGIFSLQYDRRQQTVKMEQNAARFAPFTGTRSDLAALLHTGEHAIRQDLPVVYANTGLWTLLVPIVSKEECAMLFAYKEHFPSVLKEYPFASVHPFVFSTFLPEADIHCRHFCSFRSGYEEDAATGTAGGALASYCLKYVYPDQEECSLVIEQGTELGKKSLLSVHAVRRDGEIYPDVEGNVIFCGSDCVDLG